MPRPIGLEKTGGRKKGTPNKNTLFLREALFLNGVDIVAQIAEILPLLRIETRAEVLLNLMSFVFPKRKPIDHFLEAEKHSQEKSSENAELRHARLAQRFASFAKLEEDPKVAEAYKTLADKYNEIASTTSESSTGKGF